METLDQSERDVESKLVLVDGVFCVRVVVTQQGVVADAKHRRIVVGESEAEEVCRESSQIEPRVRLPARLEAIKIKTTVHSVVDAVPTKCAVDRRQGARPHGRNALLNPTNAVGAV